MINPLKFRAESWIGKACRIDRDSCILSPSRYQQANFPENFDRLMSLWDESAQDFLLVGESMKAKLERIEQRLIELWDEAHDDELADALDDAVLHIQSAIDRLIAIEEESDDDE